MTTLIDVQGAGAGRCDAKCYSATTPDCDCVCGGKNHGVGLRVAKLYVSTLADEQVREIERRGGIIPGEFRQRDLLEEMPRRRRRRRASA